MLALVAKPPAWGNHAIYRPFERSFKMFSNDPRLNIFGGHLDLLSNILYFTRI